jgi:hypothetical protein
MYPECQKGKIFAGLLSLQRSRNGRPSLVFSHIGNQKAVGADALGIHRSGR